MEVAKENMWGAQAQFEFFSFGYFGFSY